MSAPRSHPHLGELIAVRLNEIGMAKAEFGRRINTSRQNVSLILKKRSIDTEQLWRICEVLGQDFFSMLSERNGAGSANARGMELRLEFANRCLLLVCEEEPATGKSASMPGDHGAEQL